MRLKLIRLTKDKKNRQKIGKLFVFDTLYERFSCYTLEPFDSIPAGHYDLVKYLSPNLGHEVLLFEYVPNHTFIEIHNGNFLSQTKLCVLVGENVADINADGLKDVAFSKVTLSKILSLVPNEIQIDIFENPSEFAI